MLQYVNIEFCVKNPEIDERDHANWQRRYPVIINKEVADENGFFWYITEQKIFEISAVSLGSNPYTPPQERDKSLDTIEPSQGDTQKENEPTKPKSLEDRILTLLRNEKDSERMAGSQGA